MVRYVQLAHNRRDPKTHQSKARVLWSFGREEEIDQDGLRRRLGIDRPLPGASHRGEALSGG